VKIFAFSTHKVNQLSVRTLALTLPFLLILLLLLEGVLRLNFVHGRLETSRLGSRHSQLGEKLRLVEAVIAREGNLDCIMLGSSVVDNGFYPAAFSRAYQETTGKEITCFNFGIDAIPGATAGVLAEIIVQDYQPDILIYGIDGRDFAVARDTQDTKVVLDSPWIKYRSGRFNLEGWLFEHSYLKRYTTQLKQLLVFDYESALWKPKEGLTPLGYNALYEVDLNVQIPPESLDDSFQVTYLSELLADFNIPQENLEGLIQVLELNSEEVKVFVVVMPVADGYYSFYGNGRSDYDSFVNQIEAIVTNKGIPFLRPLQANQIPADGWFDYMHVNATGADVFSSWLGTEVGVDINSNS
jgi:hypothetical protein